MRILLVEDDEALCEGLDIHLRTYGYELMCCYDGDDGLEYIKRKGFELVILDRMLPSMDGLSIVKEVRKAGIHTPILMLTALGHINEKVEGLEAGADDYLAKPFAIEELVARIKALSRRNSQWEDGQELLFGDLRLDLVNHKLMGPQGGCSLSKKECRLAEVLFRSKKQTIEREQLFYKVWGIDAIVEDANLDNYIHFLRKRLKMVGSQTNIKTVHGLGYLLE